MTIILQTKVELVQKFSNQKSRDDNLKEEQIQTQEEIIQHTSC
jgi:hypothetical protein